MDCAIYTRVSTDNQAEIEFNSCQAQEAKVRAFISSQENFKVFKVYEDGGFSGANLNRPQLQAMLEDIKDKKVNAVVAYKIDRLTRSPKDFYQLIELFEQYGVDFISVTERFDTSSPSGRLLRNIMLTFAQFERELASERTKDKMLQRASKGMWNGGNIPFGYKTEDKKLVISEPEAKIVREMYENYISKGSIAKIYTNLNSNSLSKSRIFYILTNPVYTGQIKYAGKFSPGNHQPIISEDTFNLAQEIHKKKTRKLRLYRDYSLAGLVKCKVCGSNMTPCYTNKKKHNKMKRYYYYRCTKTFKRDWKSCEIRQVSASRLESYVFESIERISRDKHYLDSLIFKLNNSRAGGRNGLELSPSCSESEQISPEIFGQTLQEFAKNLPNKKGIEKNLWAKKFIKNIVYSKEEIAISLYYKRGYEEYDSPNIASGGLDSATGQNRFSNPAKKIPTIHMDSRDRYEWLPGLDSNQRPSG